MDIQSRERFAHLKFIQPLVEPLTLSIMMIIISTITTMMIMLMMMMILCIQYA